MTDKERESVYAYGSMQDNRNERRGDDGMKKPFEETEGPCKIICVNRKYKCVQGDSRCTKEAQKKKMY